MRPQKWSTGPIEVAGPSALQAKGTLLEGAGGGGQALVPPAHQPGIVSKLFEPLGIAAVFGSSQTTSREVRYMVEGTATSGAAGVAEAGLKPESTLGYVETTEPIRKIATFLPASDEMIEDAPSIQAYLNQRLTLFVRIEEERQLLRGNGTNELVGIFNRSGAQQINAYTKLAGDTNVEAVAKVIANTYGSSFVAPDTVVMHPSNWLARRLLRAGTAGEFFGGGPWGPAYGGNTGLFGESMWGVRVVINSVVGLGTALVGNFGQSAHVWRRGGLVVEGSNSHQDFFQRDLTALRAETRLGLGIYRPTAFTQVVGLTS